MLDPSRRHGGWPGFALILLRHRPLGDVISRAAPPAVTHDHFKGRRGVVSAVVRPILEEAGPALALGVTAPTRQKRLFRPRPHGG